MNPFDPETDITWVDRFNKATGMDPRQYILSHPGDIIVAEQLHCYPKAAIKFPRWHRNGLAYSRLALEQSSGELAALYKSELIGGETLWDLTGGLGMDSYAFSMSFKTVHYCDPATQPYNLARYNHRRLGAVGIIHHNIDAQSAINSLDGTEWVFLDPSRRDHDTRAFVLDKCVPNVKEFWPLITEKCKGIMVKLSPMYDLTAIGAEIPGINEIHVVSVHGEVREILAIKRPEGGLGIVGISLPDRARYSRNMEPEPFDNAETSDRQTILNLPVGSNSWIHVPDPVFIKAGLVREIVKSNDCLYLGRGGYLWGSTSNVPGCRSYRIIDIVDYKPSLLKKRFKSLKVNIHKRHFPNDVNQLYRILSATMGDDLHLFFTTTRDEGRIVVIAEPRDSSTQA